MLIFFSIVAGRDTNLSHFIPGSTVLYLAGGVALGVLGAFMFIPKLRGWLRDDLRPQITEVLGELSQLARNPTRFLIIVGGSAATTLGAALALWASVEAFGGGTTFITVTIVTMIGGTLASAGSDTGWRRSRRGRPHRWSVRIRTAGKHRGPVRSCSTEC